MFHRGVDIAKLITSIIVQRLALGGVIEKEPRHVQSSLDKFTHASGTQQHAKLGLRKTVNIDR